MMDYVGIHNRLSKIWDGQIYVLGDVLENNNGLFEVNMLLG